MTQEHDRISLGQTLFSGTVWMFGMRWLVRLLTVANVVIVARFLEKDDYGIAAMAAAVVALPTTFLELGVEQAIIREHKPAPGIYDTAWTFKVIQMIFAAALVFAAAPWAAEFYGDSRLLGVLQVLAISVLILGFENIWMVSYRKNMDFRKDFLYEIIVKFLSVSAGIGLAIYYKSYWALIYAQVAASIIRLGVSFSMAPRFPRFSIGYRSQIWDFSRWTIFRSLASYIVLQSDKLILGRLASSAEVGAYSMGRDIADLPITEISVPANRSLGPGFAEMQNDRPRLAAALHKALGAIATISVPASVGLALVAPELIIVVLGEKWSDSIIIIQILSISGIMFTIRNVMGNALVVIGRYKLYSIIVWLRALVFVPVAIIGSTLSGAQGMASSFICAELVAMCVMLAVYRKIMPELSLGKMLDSVHRPVLSAVVMSVLLLWMKDMELGSEHVRLVLEIVTGAIMYGLCIYLLWRIEGKPDSIERLLSDRIASFRKFT